MLERLRVTDAVATPASSRWAVPDGLQFAQYFLVCSVVLGTTLAAFLLHPWIGYRAVGLLYMLAVVLLALIVGRGPTLLAAALSALSWEFFLIPPFGSLQVTHSEDAIMVAMYFVVAIVLGQLTSRLRAQERLERQREARATALYLLARELLEATSLDDWAHKVVAHLSTAFSTKTAILLPDLTKPLGYSAHPASVYELSGPEQPVAQSVFENRLPAGRFTLNHSKAEALFVPLISGQQVLAVLALNPNQSDPPTHEQRDLLEAVLQQMALALDRHRLRDETSRTRLLAESERLSKTLLNSMSHEIRTPLAAIQSAAGQITELPDQPLSVAQHQMLEEIQEAARRLNRLVGKVLDTARLEAGTVKPKLTPCDITDLVHMAVKETRKELAQHKLTVEVAPGLPLVVADFVLLQQAVMNLLSNAAVHTPPGTPVELSARIRDGALVLTVADRGPGLAPESLPRLFDKFYRAPAAPTGGTGLGLSLVKGFAEAQGGTVKAENRLGGGAAFTIYLPVSSPR